MEIFFLYHLLNYKTLLLDLSYDDITSFFYFVIPAIVLLLLFALLEDYLVPEEYSKKKLIDKLLQSLIMCLLLYITNFTSLIKETYLRNSAISLMIFNSFILRLQHEKIFSFTCSSISISNRNKG